MMRYVSPKILIAGHGLKGLRRIAFPSISTGVYRYPVGEAADVAVRSVIETIQAHPGDFDEILFCGFDAGTEREYARALDVVDL